MVVEGNRLGNALRVMLKEHYGVRAQKLAEFGLQPFRGRSRKATPGSPETPGGPEVSGTPGTTPHPTTPATAADQS